MFYYDAVFAHKNAIKKYKEAYKNWFVILSSHITYSNRYVPVGV